MSRIRVRAAAKVNLHLEVGARRSGGYHRVVSLLQIVDLYDVLHLSPAGDGGYVDVLVPAGLDARENLVTAAIALFRSVTGINHGVRVALQKRIPIGAGLGGGSSDAAATVRGLCTLFDRRISAFSAEDLTSLGADVPFFAGGPAAAVEGIGDIVRSIPPRTDFWIVAVHPGIAVATSDAYQWLDRSRALGGEEQGLTAPGGVAERYMRLPIEKWGFRNDFDAVVCEHHHVLRRMLGDINSVGAQAAQLSGSGSVGLGVFSSESAARYAVQELGARWPEVWMLQPLDQIPPVELLS